MRKAKTNMKRKNKARSVSDVNTPVELEAMMTQYDDISKMRRFYDVETDTELILAQADHVERLQAKLKELNNNRLRPYLSPLEYREG